MEWNNESLERYSRHIVLKDIGIEGQEKISSAKIAIIGLGGIGSVIAAYLTSAGANTLGLIDGASLKLEHLYRHNLFNTKDIGKLKTSAIKKHLNALNPLVNIKTHNIFLDKNNAKKILKNYDLIIDAIDNLAVKFLINEVCATLGKTYIHANVTDFGGQVMSIDAKVSACFTCAFNAPPKNVNTCCASSGILAPMPAIVGGLAASEALKIIVGIKNPLFGNLLCFEARDFTFSKILIDKNPNCPICKDN